MRGIQYAVISIVFIIIISYGHIAVISGRLYIVLNMNIRTTTVCYVERVLVRPAGTHSASQFTGVSSFTRSLKAARVQNSGDPGRCFPSSEQIGNTKLRFWYRMRTSKTIVSEAIKVRGRVKLRDVQCSGGLGRLNGERIVCQVEPRLASLGSLLRKSSKVMDAVNAGHLQNKSVS